MVGRPADTALVEPSVCPQIHQAESMQWKVSPVLVAQTSCWRIGEEACLIPSKMPPGADIDDLDPKRYDL